MNDIIPLYDRIEVLEQTIKLLLSHLKLEVIDHTGVYLELKELDERPR